MPARATHQPVEIGSRCFIALAFLLRLGLMRERRTQVDHCRIQLGLKFSHRLVLGGSYGRRVVLSRADTCRTLGEQVALWCSYLL